MNNKLQQILKKLSQGAKESVQNGNVLSDFDCYMHVERPVEKDLRKKIEAVQENGGGIVFLVGNAGDGKSHAFSCLKSLYPDFYFYNDATESYSPKANSTETLSIVLREYEDDRIETTKSKYVIAINLGKLNAFVESFGYGSNYSKLTSRLKLLFEKDTDYGFKIDCIETDRIKICQFQFQNIYEFDINKENEAIVNSEFLMCLLEKITFKSDANPFYKAYCETKDDIDSCCSPEVINYELLMLDSIKNAIVKYIIEAIVRFKLTVTPREFLNFIYSILVFEKIGSYKKNQDFFKSLLPTLLFEGDENSFLRTIKTLDPLKEGNKEHNSDLGVLFTSLDIPTNVISQELLSSLPRDLIQTVKDFYGDNGRRIEDISKLLFRLKHLLDYHSESSVYTSFLNVIAGCCNDNKYCKNELFQLVRKSIPRSYGSYYERDKVVPLNIQGGKSKLFAPVVIKFESTQSHYLNSNVFDPYITMTIMANEKKISLDIDYGMYSYLTSLATGKLTLNYSNSKNMKYYKFISDVIKASKSEENVIALYPHTSYSVGYDEVLNIISIEAV